MKSGPAPKPTNLKKLEGNPGKRKLPVSEPRPDNALPACPPFLKGAARKEWQRLAKELNLLGLLTRVDRAAFAGYCIAWGQLEEVNHELGKLAKDYKDTKRAKKKNPNLQVTATSNGLVRFTDKQNVIMEPLLSVRKQALEIMHKFLVEFGMTPASRSRIVVEKYKEKDPMDELLDGNRNN